MVLAIGVFAYSPTPSVQYYNVKSARPSVDELSEERAAKDMMRLSRLYRDMCVLEGVYVMLDNGEEMWQLAKRDKETGKSKELVFTATSALAHMDLPPITRETLNMIHTEENDVKYYRGMFKGSKKRYVGAKPQIFRVGDIVEVQCSIVFMRSKGSSIKMKLILRGVAMVNCDGAMNTDCKRRKGTRSEMGAASGRRMKRKVGFEYKEDGTEEHSTSKKHMEEVKEGIDIERGMEEREGMME
ncbi:hypothetical protein EDD85DRAFT_791937 [Armillaria nabsnona]|nr:hypothetical protein EDD85DRAFT_791937 [Armillaria nabsnona]